MLFLFYFYGCKILQKSALSVFLLFFSEQPQLSVSDSHLTFLSEQFTKKKTKIGTEISRFITKQELHKSRENCEAWPPVYQFLFLFFH